MQVKSDVGKKYSPCLASALTCALLLGGCGGESDGDEGSSITPPTAENIATAIVGAWQSACQALPLLNTSERRILAFDGSKAAQDLYQYDGLDCAGVPRGTSFPLRLYSYSIGDELVQTNQSTAREIDLEITQLSDVGVLRDGASLGQMRYGIVGFNASGQLMFDDGTTSSPDNRPVSFNQFLTPLVSREPISTGINSIADVAGIYRSNCNVLNNSGSSYSNTVITESTGDIFDYYFFNDYCAGDSIMQIITPVTLSPEPQGKTTFFGDSVIEVLQSDAEQEVVSGGEFLSFDLKAARERYTLYALGNGDTLLRGDCVVRETVCKTSSDYFADMIDLEFNSHLRHKKVDSIEYSNVGDTNSSAIAGLWNFSDEESNIYAYQMNQANGMSTYYEVEGGSPDSSEACIRAYQETLTAFDDDVYLFEHTADSQENSYSFYFRQVVEDNVLIQSTARGDGTSEYPALDELPTLPDCT